MFQVLASRAVHPAARLEAVLAEVAEVASEDLVVAEAVVASADLAVEVVVAARSADLSASLVGQEIPEVAAVARRADTNLTLF